MSRNDAPSLRAAGEVLKAAAAFLLINELRGVMVAVLFTLSGGTSASIHAVAQLIVKAWGIG